jgi:hypothetical protein
MPPTFSATRFTSALAGIASQIAVRVGRLAGRIVTLANWARS